MISSAVAFPVLSTIGRPKGSAGREVGYLCRFTLSDGSYAWVYPNEEFADPKEAFCRAVFGSFSLKNGRPAISPGIFSTFTQVYVGKGKGTTVNGVRQAYRFDSVSKGKTFVSVQWGPKFRSIFRSSGAIRDRLAKFQVGSKREEVVIEKKSVYVPPSAIIDPDPISLAKEVASETRRKRTVVAKFGSVVAMNNHLRDFPATTLMTLGKVTSSRGAIKVREALRAEWSPILTNLAAEFAGSAKAKSYKSLRDDFFQEGFLFFFEFAEKYEAKKDPSDRFDKLMYTSIKNHLLAYAKCREDEVSLDSMTVTEQEKIVRHHEEVVLVRTDIPVDEQAEYIHLAGSARCTLSAVLNNPSLDETYRRAFLARLWLDGEDDPGTCRERSVLGANGIAKKYPNWRVPETGEIVDLSNRSPTTMHRYVNSWYKRAIDVIRISLSRPSDDGDIHVQSEAVSAEDCLVSSLLGSRLTQTRELSQEGEVVKRYLELEAKLAGPTRRRTFSLDLSLAGDVLL